MGALHRRMTKPLVLTGAGDPADDGRRDGRHREHDGDRHDAGHLLVAAREALTAQAERERQDERPDDQERTKDPEGVHRGERYRTVGLRFATARTRAGGCGNGSACGPRRGGRGLRGRGCLVPPPPSPSTVASSGGAGSAWMARQTMMPSATIGIFSPTMSHRNAHVTVVRMLPLVGVSSNPFFGWSGIIERWSPPSWPRSRATSAT